MMESNKVWMVGWAGVLPSVIVSLAIMGSVLPEARGGPVLVGVKPVILTAPTGDADNRRSNAPDSVASVDPGGDFFVEIWASNTAGDQPGLACVSTDLYYPTAFLDAAPPIEDGVFFPINPVAPVFDDGSGLVDDCSGCQAAPPISGLGVNEWVLVDRVSMNALDGFLVGTGDYLIELTDADNIFAGVSLIGYPDNLDPSEVDFQSVQITPEPSTLVCTLLAGAWLFRRRARLETNRCG